MLSTINLLSYWFSSFFFVWNVYSFSVIVLYYIMLYKVLYKPLCVQNYIVCWNFMLFSDLFIYIFLRFSSPWSHEEMLSSWTDTTVGWANVSHTLETRSSKQRHLSAVPTVEDTVSPSLSLFLQLFYFLFLLSVLPLLYPKISEGIFDGSATATKAFCTLNLSREKGASSNLWNSPPPL